MQPMTETQLQEIQKAVMHIALDAGHTLLQYAEQPIQQATKSSDVDIVTAADKATEELLIKELTRRYPDHHIIGEEGGGTGADAATAAYFWYIDPIDGTSNFASGVPHYCISLALTDAHREPILGVVYDPSRDEMFTAYRAGGAHLNGLRIRVSSTADLKRAIVASGFGYDKATTPDNNLRQWGNFTLRTRGIRRFGSAALDLCYVAAGRFDGYWERTLNPWDALAGMLLVQEAGGKVTDYTGGTTPQHSPDGRYLASNGHLHAAMMQVLAL